MAAEADELVLPVEDGNGGSVALRRLAGEDALVWVLELRSKPLGKGKFDNAISPGLLTAVDACLDRVVGAGEGAARALVVTAPESSGVFCSGLDLEWLMAQELGGPVQLEFLAQLHRFYARLLTLAVPTVCAIQGHCFAGGWLLALCCDYRVMTAERGAACMTEVDFGATLTPPLTALIKEKLPRRLSARMMLEACRLGAPELAAEGAVDAAVSLAQLLPVAEDLARKAAKGGASATYGAIKEDMYSDAVRALRHGPVARSAL